MNILDAIADPNLFSPFLGSNHATWEPWFGALAVLYGLPLRGHLRRATIRTCTGRKCRSFPKPGFTTALFLTGRRSGKSRIAALIAAYEATLAGHHKKLAKGERGIVAVIAPTKAQAAIVKGYIRSIFDVPLLHSEIIAETQDGFDLANGVSIQILAGDHRSVRGFTLLAAVVDEAAFFGLDAEARVKSDTELIRALQPGLATTGGRLIAISSPYARKGWCWRTYERYHGNNSGGKVLVWQCPSRTMNSTLPQSVVDDAMADDLQAAKSEYLGEFRDDIAEFMPRSLIESSVVKGRFELLPRPRTDYIAFADLSGGRSDDAALAIGHRENGKKVVVDLLRRYRPPCNPNDVIAQMVGELRKYGVRRVMGDNYAAEFVSRGFQGLGIHYLKSEKVKSALYLELFPRVCSGEIELLDNPQLVNQMAGLERRTRSGGRDIVDHPPGGHDDCANVIAGVAEMAGKRRLVVGGFDLGADVNAARCRLAAVVASGGALGPDSKRSLI